MKPVIITLKNGMKIGFVKSKVPLFRIELVIRSGMLNESPKQVGFAHFIEHLMSFFPSSKYPDAVMNQQLMDNSNFVSNAWTSEYDCGFYIEGLLKHIPFAIDLVFQNYIDPKLSKEIFEQERQAVIQELESMSDDTWYPLEHLIQYTFFRGTVLEQSLFREIEHVKKCASVQNILDYRKKFYKPNNTVVIITANMTENTFKELCKTIEREYFPNSIKTKNIVPKVVPVVKPKPGIYYISPSSQDTNTVNVNIYFPLNFNQFHRNNYVVNTLITILTGSMGARLYYALRTKLGAVYNVTSSVDLDPTNQRNYFVIDFETRSSCAKDAFDYVMIELSELINNELTQEEVDKIKNKVEYEITMERSVASFKKCTELFSPAIIWNKRVKGMSEIHNIIKSVTPKEISNLALQIFNPGRMIVFYSGKHPILDRHPILPHFKASESLLKSAFGKQKRGMKRIEKIVKIIKSTRQYKKYRAIVSYSKGGKRKTRVIDFGDNRYEQYRDSTKLKLYSRKNHGDARRRKNYFTRHSGTPAKQKALAKEWKKSKGRYNPKILSHQYLW